MPLLIFLMTIMLSSPAMANPQPLTIDLAKKEVDITTAFSGATMALYGVTQGPGDVIVVIRGPRRDMKVRKKQSIFGAWMNRDYKMFKDVPSFYRVLGSKNPADLLPVKVLEDYGIGLENLKRNMKPENTDKTEKSQIFRNALVRNKSAKSLYAEGVGDITFLGDGFFKFTTYLPANVPVGLYDVETYYIENKKIIDIKKTNMKIEQIGLSQDIKSFSANNSFVYGLGCVFLALFSGWFSNRVRRRA